MRSSLWWVVLAGVSCSVPFSDELHYSCGADRDCGGDGFVCVRETDGRQFCCKSTGAEVCGDGIDNDCNGLIDGEDHWPAETCNGLDDDCDGRVDEDFHLQFDDTNCGSCGHACPKNQTCQAAQCVSPP